MADPVVADTVETNTEEPVTLNARPVDRRTIHASTFSLWTGIVVASSRSKHQRARRFLFTATAENVMADSMVHNVAAPIVMTATVMDPTNNDAPQRGTTIELSVTAGDVTVGPWTNT